MPPAAPTDERSAAGSAAACRPRRNSRSSRSASRKVASAGSSSSTIASASSIAIAAISIDSPRNWTISCLRLAPSTLRSATSRARWLARAVARLVKLTQAMPRISKGDDREGDDRAPVVARRHRAVLRLAEMDVADVDEPPVLLVAGDWCLLLADILVGDVALFPGRQLARGSSSGSVPGFSVDIDTSPTASPSWSGIRACRRSRSPDRCARPW